MQGDRRSNAPVSQGLPRQLYWIIVGLGLWLTVSIWGFAGSGYTALVFAVVAALIALAVGLVLLAIGVARARRGGAASEPRPGSLGEWLGREFESHTGRMQG
ncbi:MAG TPA: hypothetical protein VMB84_11945, partial [Stellaceae bacterium]|nr:hypothetical protein [Stellaceae bacterium]